MGSSDTNLSRRLAIRGMGALGVLSQSSLSFAAASKHIFIEPFDLILEFLPELNAGVGGHFSANDLDIEIINARGTSLAVQQLIAKQATFTKLGALDLMKAVALQNIPLLSVATIQQGAIFSVVSLKSAPIEAPAAMRGKTIGVASLGGGTENNLDLMLAGAGVPSKEVARQAVGLSPGSVELLKQNRIQAFFATVEVAVALRRANEPVHIWSVDRFAPIPGGVYVVTREFAQQNPDTVAKFVKSLRASVSELISSDPNTILDRVEKKYQIAGNADRAYRIDALKSYNELILANGKDNVLVNVPEVWRKGAELASKAQVVGIQNIEDLYTNRFVN